MLKTALKEADLAEDVPADVAQRVGTDNETRRVLPDDDTTSEENKFPGIRVLLRIKRREI